MKLGGPERVNVEVEVTRLRDLDLAALRLRWRNLMPRPAPAHLPRHLMMKILAYRMQADAYGDCDEATSRLLDEVSRTSGREGKDQRPLPSSTRLRPGTLLVREWAGVQHRVMALDAGFAWNGSTYASLSHVARAITGTRWSGPRFFGVAAGDGRP